MRASEIAGPDFPPAPARSRHPSSSLPMPMTAPPDPTQPEVQRSRVLIVCAVLAHTVGFVLVASKALVTLITGEAAIPNVATGVPLVIHHPLPLGLYAAGLVLTAAFTAISTHIYLCGKKPAGALWWSRAAVFAVVGLAAALSGVILAMAGHR